MTPFSFLIDLPVRNEWANIDLVRSAVLNCFSAVFKGVEGCRAFAVVAGELMENAIKHGNWGADERPFRLQIRGDAELVEVCVENPVDRDAANIADLFGTLDWLGRFASPQEAYRQRLLELASTPRRPDESRLGLVRIAYECNCRLSAELDGGLVRVRSRMPIAPADAGVG